MTVATVPVWSVVYGSCVVRADVSLAKLARRPVEERGVSVCRLGDSLSLIQPLNAPTDTPWSHLRHCRNCAREIVANPEFHLSQEWQDCLISIYETGLIAGFDDIFFFPPGDQVGAYSRADIEDIGAIAWRHGSTIRQWWASYARLVDALFGGRSS